MTDDTAFDADLRRRAGVGRKLTLTAETDQERGTQAAFAKALTGSRADDIAQRLFGHDDGPEAA